MVLQHNWTKPFDWLRDRLGEEAGAQPPATTAGEDDFQNVANVVFLFIYLFFKCPRIPTGEELGPLGSGTFSVLHCLQWAGTATGATLRFGMGECTPSMSSTITYSKVLDLAH